MNYFYIILLLLFTSINSNAAWVQRAGDTAGFMMDLDVNKNFSLIYGGQGTAVLGDMTATGDSNLYVNTPNTDNYAGALYSSNAKYMLSDNAFSAATTDNRKKNASTAILNLPSYVKAEHIVSAGLFWQGQVHENVGNGLTTGTVDARVQGWNTINFKTPDGVIHPITAALGVKDKTSSTYHYGMKDTNSFRYFYGAYKDVTSLVKNSYTSTNNSFTVGNLLITPGADFGDNMFISHAYNDAGAWFGGLRMGYFGGWSLVVVYDLTGTPEASTPGEVYKNVSLYNGYDLFLTWSSNNVAPFETTIPLAGFKTPKTGVVNSKLLFFGGGADQGINFDTLQIQEKKTSTFSDLGNALNPTGLQFNNTYSDLGNQLIPGKPYHHGMDLDIFDVSNHMDNDQSNTQIKFGIVKSGNVADQIFPQVLGFSTKLYTPNICYDYSVRVGDHIKLSSENRDVNTSYWGGEPLVVKVFIRSMEADFDLINTNLKIDFTPAGKFDFIENASSISPSNLNAYIPTFDTNDSTISIGKNNSLTGGEIGANETTYAKVGFDFLTTSYVDSHFELDIQTAIQFDPSVAPIPYTLTTRGNANTFGHIGLCPRNQIYDPIYGKLNIERSDSTFSQAKAIRYPLYTQITGRDFNVSVASYGGSNLDQAQTIFDTTIELELIDAGGFDNNSSAGYDSVCEEPDAIGGEGAFILLDDTSRVQVDVKNELNYPNDLALQSAAFRVWLLTKEDANSSARLIVNHTCSSKTDQNCFKKIYDDNYKDADDLITGYCKSDCQSSGTGCYTCLKTYFASPICSRDNFSIRPESYRIAIADTNESSTTSSLFLTENSSANVDPSLTLAAGYQYLLDINATHYRSNRNTKGYYNNTFQAEDNITTLDSTKRVMAPLQFNTSTGTGCTDTTHKTLGLKIQNGILDSNTVFSHENVGQYTFSMYDSNWTNVDQASYPFKTVFDPNCKNNATNPQCNDCIVNSDTSLATGNKIGCIINSDQVWNVEYTALPLAFAPYAFALNEVNLSTLPKTSTDYLFMNDLANIYYDDPVLHPPTMSSSFIGDIAAISKNNIVTTNFTSGCAAQNVILHINRNTIPTEGNIVDSEGNIVPFEQFLQQTSSTSAIVDSTTVLDANTTLPRTAFQDTIKSGKATMFLHTNFKKPINATVNPIDINYTGLYAYAPNAASSAEMINNYIPDANQSYAKNLVYYFAKVTPQQKLYDNVKTNSILTPVYVDIYCELVAPDSCAKFNLTALTQGQDEEAGWYSASMFDQNNDGTIDLSVKTIFGDNANPSVNPNTTVQFDDGNGTQKDINVSLAGSVRPSTVEVEIKPVPWLLYDEDDPKGFPHYRIKFIGDSAWSGVGNVGRAVEATSNSNPGPTRLSW